MKLRAFLCFIGLSFAFSLAASHKARADLQDLDCSLALTGTVNAGPEELEYLSRLFSNLDAVQTNLKWTPKVDLIPDGSWLGWQGQNLATLHVATVKGDQTIQIVDGQPVALINGSAGAPQTTILKMLKGRALHLLVNAVLQTMYDPIYEKATYNGKWGKVLGVEADQKANWGQLDLSFRVTFASKASILIIMSSRGTKVVWTQTPSKP